MNKMVLGLIWLEILVKKTKISKIYRLTLKKMIA